VLHIHHRQPLRPKIYLGASAAASKVATLREQGAEVVTFGHDVVEAEMEARRAAEQSGAMYCSPYNDLQVTASHSTLVIDQHESTALVPSNDNSNFEIQEYSVHTRLRPIAVSFTSPKPPAASAHEYGACELRCRLVSRNQ